MFTDLCLAASICFECYPTKAIFSCIFWAVIVFAAGFGLNEVIRKKNNVKKTK